MNKKIARYGFIFYLLTQLLFFIFPKQLLENIYILSAYLVLCLTFLYFIYNLKTNNNYEIKKTTWPAIIFYLITMLLFFIFPKQLSENIYIMAIYVISCYIFLYFLFNRKSKNGQESIK